MKANWKISIWKGLKVILLMWIGVQVTPDQLIGFLPDQIQDLTVGALLIVGINYFKVSFGDKLPSIAKKIL